MTKAKAAALIAVGVVLAFLIGFGWQYTRATRFSAELDRADQALAFQRLEATLGAATIEAQGAAYEPARKLASDFFTGLQHDIGQAPANATAGLRAILGQRDAVITSLSRSDPQAGNVLADLFEQYRAALGETIPAPAAPAGSTAAPPH